VLLGNHEVTPEDVCGTPSARRVLGPSLTSLARHAAEPGRRPAAECWLGAIAGASW